MHATSQQREPFWRTRARALRNRLYGLLSLRRINGTWMKLPSRVAGEMAPWRGHTYEEQECNAIVQYARRGGVFVDIGANVGVLSHFLSKNAGNEGAVYSMEPALPAFKLLLQTILLNRLKNVIPMHCVVSDFCGACDFYVSERDPLSVMSSLAANDPDARSVRLPTVTIDALFGKERRIDYLKIDAEGAEVSILRGSKTTLAKWRPPIQVEVHGLYLPSFGESVETLFELMGTYQYTAINLVTGKIIGAKDFLENTHLHARNPLTGSDMAFEGYGQVVFLPVEALQSA